MASSVVNNIEQVPVTQLKPYANNPRTHSELQLERLKKSLLEFGFTNPLLVSDDLEIVAGHGRLMAAQALDYQSVPCIKLSHLTEDQRRAYVIADNQLALNSAWDDELLQSELQALADTDFDLTVLGWGDDLPSFADEPDYSALEDLDDPTEELADGVMKAIQIEFRPEDYDEATALINAARKRGEYVGMKIIEALA